MIFCVPNFVSFETQLLIEKYNNNGASSKPQWKSFYLNFIVYFNVMPIGIEKFIVVRRIVVTNCSGTLNFIHNFATLLCIHAFWYGRKSSFSLSAIGYIYILPTIIRFAFISTPRSGQHFMRITWFNAAYSRVYIGTWR